MIGNNLRVVFGNGIGDRYWNDCSRRAWIAR
jgi:hypothetical protein